MNETDVLSSRLTSARAHIDVAASSQYAAIKNAAPDPSIDGPGWTFLTPDTTIFTAIVDPMSVSSILGTDTPILA